MPIILCTVPFPVNREQAKELAEKARVARKQIRAALKTEGVKSGATIEFIPCLAPERFVATYQSRDPDHSRTKADGIAYKIGEILEKLLGANVECVVIGLDHISTGLYITEPDAGNRGGG